MDDVRVGRALRALRRRRGLRQSDVGEAAGLAQSTVSLIERGHLSALSLRALRRAFAVVDARLDVQVGWRGGALDRLLDERHAALVGAFAARLRLARWQVDVEATFSEYGERGSIDLLAAQPARQVVLVVEAKTELVSIEETIRRLDVKTRLAPGVARERFGWQPKSVARVLVVAEGSTARRRAGRHGSVLVAAFPARGHVVQTWLREPVGPMSGLLFLPLSDGRGARRRLASSTGDPQAVSTGDRHR